MTQSTAATRLKSRPHRPGSQLPGFQLELGEFTAARNPSEHFASTLPPSGSDRCLPKWVAGLIPPFRPIAPRCNSDRVIE